MKQSFLQFLSIDEVDRKFIHLHVSQFKRILFEVSSGQAGKTLEATTHTITL